MLDDEMIELALAARARAYAPFSGFSVGAALLSSDGTVFTGCNVENISFGLTICAERVAVFSALSQGKRHFTKLVIVADSKVPVSPCGACRQVIAEFSSTLVIESANLQGEKFQTTIAELLPRAKEGILDHGIW